jgi:hypothetical protein
MKTFSAAGRIWGIKITVASLRRLAAEVPEADLLDVADLSARTKLLATSIGLLVRVVWSMVRSQASPTMDQAAFEDAMDAPAMDAAANAFWEAWSDFFLPLVPPLAMARALTTAMAALHPTSSPSPSAASSVSSPESPASSQAPIASGNLTESPPPAGVASGTAPSPSAG